MGWEHEGSCDCAPGEGHRVERSYCRHGIFVGDPYGPDYMCGWCEDGISDADYEAMVARTATIVRRVEALSPRLGHLIDLTWTTDLTDEDLARLGHRIARLSIWGVRLPNDWQPPRLRVEA
jgi:hypothetical protein